MTCRSHRSFIKVLQSHSLKPGGGKPPPPLKKCVEMAMCGCAISTHFLRGGDPRVASLRPTKCQGERRKALSQDTPHQICRFVTLSLLCYNGYVSEEPSKT